MKNISVADIEKEIDKGFEKSPLKSLAKFQAIWTLLSVLDFEYFRLKNSKVCSTNYINSATDLLLNSLTHPLRILQLNTDVTSEGRLKKEYNNEHYSYAKDWLEKSLQYNEMCTLFPLYYRKYIIFEVDGNLLKYDWSADIDFRYEAYNRIYIKDGVGYNKSIDSKAIIELISPYVESYHSEFKLDLSPEVIKSLTMICGEVLNDRFTLPDEWETTNFTLGSYKRVIQILKSILVARSLVRDLLLHDGLDVSGYVSTVWLIEKDDLTELLESCCSVCKVEIQSIIDILIFGNADIKKPDIALQPIVDLGKGCLALSPFVWNNFDAERNLCVLLNMIKVEKKLYSQLVNNKENVLRMEILEFIKEHNLPYNTEFGELSNTDLDLAIIDRANKICMCIELKWFIEPAEAREIHEKNEELTKGIQQAKIFNGLYKNNDSKLINDTLKIESNYDFFSIVGTRNWIGNYDVQDSDIPIIKIFHLLEKLNELHSLSELKSWLFNRNYLPKEGDDYEIIHSDIEVANWKSKTYGINILKEG